MPPFDRNAAIVAQIAKQAEDDTALSGLAELRAQAARSAKMAKALERLGSMEAFVYGGILDPVRDAELLARIDFARAALGEERG